jgi:Spy/CpxP family protein refolding chaperone
MTSGTAAALLALGAAGLATAASASASASARHHPQPGGFNHKGDILIAD